MKRFKIKLAFFIEEYESPYHETGRKICHDSFYVFDWPQIERADFVQNIEMCLNDLRSRLMRDGFVEIMNTILHKIEKNKYRTEMVLP